MNSPLSRPFMGRSRTVSPDKKGLVKNMVIDIMLPCIFTSRKELDDMCQFPAEVFSSNLYP
jgi:hypothetical protein